MKSISKQNEENEKTEVLCSESFKMDIRWVPFNATILGSGDKVESGRGGELLKKTYQLFSGTSLEVKCSKTELLGKLYWKHAIKNTIDRIEWDDGVINKY